MKLKVFFVFAFLVFGDVFFASDVNKIEVEGNISQLKIYKGNFFFGDKKSINIYRYSDKFKLLNIIGKKGEGPGELTELYGFDFTKNFIYLQSRAKIVFFSLDGRLAKEIIKPRASYFIVLNNGNMIERFTEYNSDNKPGLTKEKVYFCDTDFKRVKLLIVDSEMKKPGMPFEDFINGMEVKYSSISGKIIISQRNNGFLFYIFDDNGNLLNKIEEKGINKIKVSKKFIKDFKAKLLSDPRMRSNLQMAKQLMKQIKFSEFFPPFHSYYIDENGSIFIRTYVRKSQRLLYKKYSSDGKFLKDIFIEDNNPDIYETRNVISFYKNQLFFMTENEDGEFIIEKSGVN